MRDHERSQSPLRLGLAAGAILLIASLHPGSATRVCAEPPPFTHNGEPFFPIGLWSGRIADVSVDDCRAELSAAGFNTLHRWYSQVTPATLDMDYSYGLNSICWAYAWLGDPTTYAAAIQAKINEVGQHPAFFAWDTRDEPYWNYALNPTGCGFTREGLTAGRQYINALDPVHPVLCNFAPYDLVIGHPDITFEGYQLWTSVGNAFSADRYPADGGYPNTSLTPVGYCCDQLKAIVGDNVAVYMILQGCGLGEWSGVPNPASRPNLIENRFMAYSSIIHGARGILYYGTSYLESPSCQMWADLKTVAGELSSLQDVLCRGVTANDYNVQSGGCEAIMRLYGGNRYLIVANRTSSAVSGATMSVPGSYSPAVEVLYENRTLNTTLGTFSDSFVPWGTHVYRLPFQTVSVDMGTTDNQRFLSHLLAGVPDGDTEPVTIAGREARKNVDPATDFYFYFGASDAFAYQASRPDLYVTMDYYDGDTGSLGLEYDSNTGSDVPARYKSGGIVPLTGSGQWKQQMFHVTDAYFGNRQNGGADFRIAKYNGGMSCLDVVTVSTKSPLPARASSPNPPDGAIRIAKNAVLHWAASERATSYDVYFGTTDPPPFKGNQVESAFDPENMSYLTSYYWRIDAVNGFGVTTGPQWSFTTEPHPADLDADGDVDQEDFGRLQACYSGNAHVCVPGCGFADLDSDSDVDSSDFAILLACLSGSGQPPACE